MSAGWLKLKSDDDLVDLGREDLVAFSRWPLGYTGETELWDCQRQWQDLIQEMYRQKCTGASTARHLCLLAPSEHGKTNGVVLPFILWALARNRNLRVIVAGSRDELSEQVGYGVDRLVVKYKDRLVKFGLVPAYPWNTQQKYFARDNDQLIHPSLFFCGPDTEMQGQRADIIVCTDLFTHKNSRSAESRQKVMDWMEHTLFPRLEPNGFILLEGHHAHSEDGYTVLEEFEDDFKVVKYKAILEEPCEANKGKGRVLAPEQWSYQQLARIRQRRPSVFLLMYQNQPVETVGLVNREILERALDRGRPLVNTAGPEVKAAYSKLVMGVDPAFSIRRWSKYSACWLIGVTHDGHQDLLGGWRLRILPHQLRAKVVQSILAWMPDDVYIEANAAQIFLIEEVRRQLNRIADRIHPVYTLGTGEDTAEETVSSIVAMIEAGRATLPYLGQEAQALSEQLFTEIINFPTGRYTDLIMAWAVAHKGLTVAGRSERRVTRFAGIASAVAALRRGRTPDPLAPYLKPRPIG